MIRGWSTPLQLANHPHFVSVHARFEATTQLVRGFSIAVLPLDFVGMPLLAYVAIVDPVAAANVPLPCPHPGVVRTDVRQAEAIRLLLGRPRFAQTSLGDLRRVSSSVGPKPWVGVAG